MSYGKGNIVPGGVGDPTQTPLSVDSVDRAVAAVGLDKVVSYMRPKMLVRSKADPNQNFFDRMMVGVSVGAGGAGTGVQQVLTANDPGFAGNASIDVSAAGTGPYALSVQPPAAFTYIAPIRLNNRTATGSIYCIYRANDDASGYVAEFAGPDVKIGVTWGTPPQPDIVLAGATPTSNVAHILLLSHDPVAKMNHFAIDSVDNLLGGVTPDALKTSSAAVAHPFSYVAGSGGVPLNGRHAGWALFNEAYGAGDANFDTSIVSLINAWKAFVGVA